jgi:lipopolysaccharide export system permease protein
VLIDRYIVRGFVLTFVFSCVALCLIFVIVDMIESLDDFLDHKAPFMVVVEFYMVFLPAMLKLLIPIGLLLAALFSVGRLASANEITAMRSGGQSLARFMLPLLLVGVLCSVLQIRFNGWVVPAANGRKFAIERTYLGRSPDGPSLMNLAFRETPLRNVIIAEYDTAQRIARRVAIEEYSSSTSPRLLRRIDATEMQLDSSTQKWIVLSGIQRQFNDGDIVVESVANLPVDFTVQHAQIVRLQRNPDEFTFDDRADYIATLRKGGKDTRRQEVALAAEWAFPWANAIVVLLAVPFASVRRRAGVAVNIVMAMTLCFVYIASAKIGQAIGAETTLPVEIVAWAPNILFLIAGIVITIRTRI